MRTFVEPSIKKFQYSQSIAQVSECCPRISTTKGPLSCPELNQLSSIRVESAPSSTTEFVRASKEIPARSIPLYMAIRMTHMSPTSIPSGRRWSETVRRYNEVIPRVHITGFGRRVLCFTPQLPANSAVVFANKARNLGAQYVICDSQRTS